MSNGVSYARNILQFTENKEILNGYLAGLVDHYYEKMGWRTDLDTISDMDRQAMTLALGFFENNLTFCYTEDPHNSTLRKMPLCYTKKVFIVLKNCLTISFIIFNDTLDLKFSKYQICCHVPQ